MTEESLFHEALARDPADRAAFLAAACAGRADLRAAVEALLAAHDPSADFLARPAVAQLVASDVVETENRAGSTDRSREGSATDDAAATTRTGPAAPPDAPAPVPERIGRYQVREELGRGGMGTVYLAHDPELDRPVALKVPKVAGPDAGERFLREARAAAAVGHPNLCPVHDAGRADGLLYLAMAYVPGDTLARVLKREGTLPAARAAAVAAGVARGMAEAHRHGIVHRDLKPGNILFDRRGEPVVTDFGLARRASMAELASDSEMTTEQDPRLTQAGAVVGTPAYMPPEQARGDQERIGPASDVYALGAILFEMLAGRPPFKGATVAETLRKIEADPVPPLPGVPARLAAVCRKALARDPADRWPSMDAFAAALAPFAAARHRRWGRTALAAAAVVLLVAAATVIYVKTDKGMIEVRLSDPAADVQVAVDGEEVRIADGNRITKVRTGDHTLLVTGPDFETDTQQFKVTRGRVTVLTVTLRPKEKDGEKGPPSPTPEQLKLAGLLARGEQLIEQARFPDLEGVIDEALKIDPESPTALALRANLRQHAGDVAGARADAEAALKLNPEIPRALLLLSILFGNERKWDECIAVATIVTRLRPDNPWCWSNRAASYFQKKEYHQAIADATRAVDLGLRRPDGYMTRGTSHACLGEYESALADLDAAVRVTENDPRPYFERAVLHLKMGHPDKAEADRRRAEAIDPSTKGVPLGSLPDPPRPPKRKKLTPEQAADLDRALAAVAQAFQDRRYPDALKAADEAIGIDPTSAPARVWRTRALVELGRYPAALTEAAAALPLAPADADLYTARGIARGATGSPAAAIADLTVALTLNPRHTMAWGSRGFAYGLRGQHRQAVADLTEAIGIRPTAVTHANRGSSFVYLGEYAKALADYQEAARLEPTNPRWLMACSTLRARLGDPEGAKADRDRAVQLDSKVVEHGGFDLPAPLPPAKIDPVLPKAVDPVPDRTKLAALLARGRRLLADGKYDALGAVADEALAVDPESPTALALRATSLAETDPAAARAAADAALQLNPETFQALVVRAYVDRKDRPADSVAASNVAIRLDPKNPGPYLNRAQAFIHLKEYRQALADADRALKLGYHQPVDPHLTRGWALACLGRYPEALAEHDQAERLAPTNPFVFAQRSIIHAEMGHKDRAAADRARALQADKDFPIDAGPTLPDPPKPPDRMKLSADEARNLDRALAAFDRAWGVADAAGCRKAADEACRLDPTSARARSNRARIRGMDGDSAGALADAAEAIRLDPADAWAYSVRAAIRVTQGDPAAAVADATVALGLDDRNPTTWNTRAWAYLRLKDYHQAIADATAALARRARYELPHSNRGEAYLNLGDYPRALADYEKALELVPTNTKWRLICAAIRAKLKDGEGARKDRDVALSLNPKLKDEPEVFLPVPRPPVKTDPEGGK